MRSMTRPAGLMLVFLAWGAAARAETTDCTEIADLPYQVTAPGLYCLKASLAAPATNYGAAIEITADDVVIDLNGHTLDGAADGSPSKAIGVRATNRKNVTVRNGTIRGFSAGVWLGGWLETSTGHIAERLRADGNTLVGIRVEGAGSIVRGNLVIRTVGSIYSISGIIAIGAGVHVIGNEVVDTIEPAGKQAIGINVGNAPGGVIEGNMVSNAAFGPTDSYGIYVSNTCPKIAVIRNRVAHMRRGISVSASGVTHENTVGGATVPFSGPTVPGTTNFSY
jgi:hypothetical protein